MREDILKSISKENNVTDIIILTHNIDYIFIQTVVLSYLKKCGNPSLTIFADAQCAQETYDNQKLVISGLGKRYRVVPVHLKRSYDRFHPKAVLLSGEKKASLYVGSGNLTFGGWRQNAEIWNHYDTEIDGTGAFSAFKGYLEGTLKQLPQIQTIEKAVAEAYDTETKLWTADLDEPVGLIGRINTKQSMLEQMKEYVELSCNRLIIQSPYFDKQGKTIEELNDLFQPNKIELLAQSRHSELTKEIIDGLPANVEVVSVDFNHDTGTSSKRAFMHAKFYAFEYDNRVVVFSGSANCSQAAMAMNDTIMGNAELMTIENMSPDEFRKRYLDELEISDESFKPMETIEIEEESIPDDLDATIQIVSAQYEYKRLKIIYNLANDFKVIGCKIGEEERIVKPVNDNLLLIDDISIEHDNKLCILLQNLQSSEVICSKEVWIDHERELSTSSKTRSLSDFIQSGSSQAWNHDKWGELIKIFNEHLTYTTKKVETDITEGEQDRRTQHATFNVDDVFLDSYSFQPVSHILTNRHNYDIYTILKQYLGMNDNTKDENEPATSLTQEEIEQQLEDDTIKIEDAQEIGKKKQTPQDEKEKIKIKKLVEAMIQAFTNADIIENRPLRQLLDDLKVASIILRTGLSDHRISEDEYFDATYTLWTELFFSSEKDSNYGYIDLKLNSESIDVSQLPSPELSAIMLAWLFAVEPSSTIKYIRLILTAIMIHAKYQWIFIGGSKEEINKELNRTLRAILDQKSVEDILQGHTDLWKLILETGKAFSELITHLSDSKVSDFKNLVPEGEVHKGELLWQGENNFYIVKSKYKRIKHNRKRAQAEVLSISSRKEEKKFLVDFTVPAKGLFEMDRELVSQNSQKAIINFIDNYLTNLSDIEGEKVDI